MNSCISQKTHLLRAVLIQTLIFFRNPFFQFRKKVFCLRQLSSKTLIFVKLQLLYLFRARAKTMYIICPARTPFNADMTPLFVTFRDYLADSSSESETDEHEENEDLSLKKAMALFILAASMEKRRKLV